MAAAAASHLRVVKIFSFIVSEVLIVRVMCVAAREGWGLVEGGGGERADLSLGLGRTMCEGSYLLCVPLIGV